MRENCTRSLSGGRRSASRRCLAPPPTRQGAALRYLSGWVNQLRWQRLAPFNKLADMLFRHLEGRINYCRVKVPFGVVEAVNGNIKALLRRGRGYKDLRYLLLKAQRMAALKTEFLVLRKAA